MANKVQFRSQFIVQVLTACYRRRRGHLDLVYRRVIGFHDHLISENGTQLIRYHYYYYSYY